MTNLRKTSSHDFDVLSKNTNMIIGDNEDQGLDLTLGLFYPIEVIIEPELGRARVRYRQLSGVQLEIEIPLGILRKQEMPFELPLGVPRFQSDLTISMPLMRQIYQVLDLLIPIHTQPEQIKILVPLKGEPKYEVWFKGTPKSKRKVVATLKALSKLLKKEE